MDGQKQEDHRRQEEALSEELKEYRKSNVRKADMQQQQPRFSKGRKRRGTGRNTVVDYTHDEVVMCLESDQEEFGEELRTADASDSQERTPCSQATPQSVDHFEQPDEMNTIVNQSVPAQNDGTSNVPAENVDPSYKFPRPPTKDK